MRKFVAFALTAAFTVLSSWASAGVAPTQTMTQSGAKIPAPANQSTVGKNETSPEDQAK